MKTELPMDKYPHIEFGDVTLRRSPKCDIRPAFDDSNHEWQNVDLNTGRCINRCRSCREWFHTRRWHAKTCSPKCRKALSRELARNKV